ATGGNRTAQSALWRISANVADIFSWYKGLADQGQAFAQENVGLAYGTGLGVDRNEMEATRLYKLAAEQNFPSAQTALAKRFESGVGVTKDLGEARTWYERAVGLGSAEAMAALGDMY